MIQFPSHHWALILGGSSGLGLAAAKRLAAGGMSVCVVHRDVRGALARVEKEFDAVRSRTENFISLNTDAGSGDGRRKTIDRLGTALQNGGGVRVVLHSIACGNLKPLAPPAPGSAKADDFSHTIASMGTDLVSWVQDLHTAGLFADDARVIGLTSEGAHRAWPGYAVVSAAKAALESTARSMAVEFAPYGIRVNVIQAGVTDTPALRAIPGWERYLSEAKRRNPFLRVTQPEDVAGVICLLATDEAAWVNGALIHVDGGEHLA